MKYRRLGSSDFEVSVICLGTMMWGDQVDEAQGHAQIEYALDHGVNFLDTAELYTIPTKSETWGNTERIIGTWLAKNPSRRSEFYLASKFTPSWHERGLGWIRDGDLRPIRKNIRAALEGSLERLQTDVIDLYQMHWPDRSTNNFGVRNYPNCPDETSVPIAETLTALYELVQEGKIRTIGISNETPWGMMEWMRQAEKLGMSKIVSVQNPYNLLDRSFEVGCAEVAVREDCGLLAYSPLGFGVLSGKYLDGQLPTGSRYEVFRDYSPRFNGTPQALDATVRYVDIARKHGLSPVTMALAWVNTRPFLTSNIIGATTIDQLKEDIESINVSLSDEIIAEINTVHEELPNPCV